MKVFSINTNRFWANSSTQVMKFTATSSKKWWTTTEQPSMSKRCFQSRCRSDSGQNYFIPTILHLRNSSKWSKMPSWSMLDIASQTEEIFSMRCQKSWVSHTAWGSLILASFPQTTVSALAKKRQLGSAKENVSTKTWHQNHISCSIVLGLAQCLTQKTKANGQARATMWLGLLSATQQATLSLQRPDSCFSNTAPAVKHQHLNIKLRSLTQRVNLRRCSSSTVNKCWLITKGTFWSKDWRITSSRDSPYQKWKFKAKS